ncbi:unnamed protein product [Adineta steineri]|uniref:Uncharacterized protein n=3 Tax=Adineta steineri TaxID=433720 RepID=A0A819PVE2_9BILA|nr:unnamed protein product [Adineta steineri]CAF3891951.1 unnamed protein product [Adineta steineri]CAF4015064.1 unnamed protein product [Adineta steineri]
MLMRLEMLMTTIPCKLFSYHSQVLLYKPTCSRLLRCNSSDNSCLQPNTICVHHPQCDDFPLCYPVTMIDQKMCPPMENKINLKWKQNGITIVGGNGQGDGLNQLHAPHGIYVDNDADSIYIADSENHRIIRWKFDADEGEIVAGGNEQGSGMHQLNYPVDVVLDREKKYLIICDYRNMRVMLWSRQNNHNQKILINSILCWGLAMDNNGDLYVSDWVGHQVMRWQEGYTAGTVVAGGSGQGNQLNQLNQPKYIFVDEYYSIYVADGTNNRVMKWMKNATEGILIAPGQVYEENHSSMTEPIGVIVDPMGNIYVSSAESHQITRWSPDAIEAVSVVGEKQSGSESTQLRYPSDLSFDRYGNLYVVDRDNHRIQKFLIDLD